MSRLLETIHLSISYDFRRDQRNHGFGKATGKPHVFWIILGLVARSDAWMKNFLYFADSFYGCFNPEIAIVASKYSLQIFKNQGSFFI